MIPAIHTIAAIEAALLADDGARFRQLQGKVLPHIGDAYSGKRDDGKRSHMGASAIGKNCARAIWYEFRWAGEKERDPEHYQRMIRLWNRGHLEEGRFIALLMMINCRVIQQDKTGKQLRFKDAHGHYAGSMDGVVFDCPDSVDGKPGLVEFKTYNEKRFKDLVSNGVRYSDETYYVQVQQYMQRFRLTWCLFLAVCKNDETLHAEIVLFDKANAEQYKDRALQLVFMDTPPMKLPRASPGRFPCNAFCDYMPVCLLGAEPDVSCRTCQFSEPIAKEGDDGKGLWYCRHDARELDRDAQVAACGNYRKMDCL